MLNVALLQVSAESMDIETNCKKGEIYCRKAAENGADICLFPEGWNIGYDLENLSALVQENRLTKNEINILSSKTDDLILKYKKLAKELSVAIGLTYINYANNEFKNNISLIDRNGNTRMTYSKVHTCRFGYERILKQGEDFYVCGLDTKIGEVKIGAMICFDREFPESARLLMLKGAEIVLIPNYCKMDRNRLEQIKTRAFENMIGVAMCNAPGEKHGHSVAYDGISFYPTEDERNMLLIEAGEAEGIYMAQFDIDALKNYRQVEVWGNAFRRPGCYGELLDTLVGKPFVRNI